MRRESLGFSRRARTRLERDENSHGARKTESPGISCYTVGGKVDGR